MCGFGIGTIFQVAIFLIVILVIFALLRLVFGSWFVGTPGQPSMWTPYWGIIQIVVGGVVAILLLLFLWKMAECAGLIGRVGWQDNIHLGLLRLLG